MEIGQAPMLADFATTLLDLTVPDTLLDCPHLSGFLSFCWLAPFRLAT